MNKPVVLLAGLLLTVAPFIGQAGEITDPQPQKTIVNLRVIPHVDLVKIKTLSDGSRIEERENILDLQSSLRNVQVKSVHYSTNFFNQVLHPFHEVEKYRQVEKLNVLSRTSDTSDNSILLSVDLGEDLNQFRMDKSQNTYNDRIIISDACAYKETNRHAYSSSSYDRAILIISDDVKEKIRNNEILSVNVQCSDVVEFETAN